MVLFLRGISPRLINRNDKAVRKQAGKELSVVKGGSEVRNRIRRSEVRERCYGFYNESYFIRFTFSLCVNVFVHFLLVIQHSFYLTWYFCCPIVLHCNCNEFI